MKILLGCVLVTTLIFANESISVQENSNKIFDLNIIKDKQVKKHLNSLETNLPATAEVIHDYFSSKFCDEYYYSKKSFNVIDNEIKSFGMTPQFGFLIAVQTLEHSEYKKIVSNYNFINCGIGKYETNLLNKKD